MNNSARITPKDVFEKRHAFLGRKLIPDSAERFLTLTGNLRLQLIDLSEDEQEVRVDEFSFPVLEEAVDEFPGENSVLEFPEAVLNFHRPSIKASRATP